MFGEFMKKASHLGRREVLKSMKKKLQCYIVTHTLEFRLCRNGVHYEEENGDGGCESLELQERGDGVISRIDL